MIFSFDIEYKKTKLIKQGKSRIDEKFENLAKWISEKYNVNVLDIQEKFNEDDNGIRIAVNVETLKEEQKFKMSEHWLSGVPDIRQKEIAEKYTQIRNSLKVIKRIPKIDDIFVVCFAFEPLAKEEVNLLIPEKRIENIYKELELPEIWKISRCFENATLFVYKDKQKNKIKNSTKFKLIEDKYFDLLKEYDEFNYWKRENIEIKIDSKQNFDDNYESNWIHYYN
ncbi:hypothetical protein [uncultured Aquimarina sp.]|uniref:hypothetical protein n=1 Tax=uncultured Aquimarina sp. TaxID=575652 RepID=UPI00262BCB14|nr:hypothetical protein [uncultured Aquimarina sp.]